MVRGFFVFITYRTSPMHGVYCILRSNLVFDIMVWGAVLPFLWYTWYTSVHSISPYSISYTAVISVMAVYHAVLLYIRYIRCTPMDTRWAQIRCQGGRGIVLGRELELCAFFCGVVLICYVYNTPELSHDHRMTLCALGIFIALAHGRRVISQDKAVYWRTCDP
jgi:hypothetical protein